MSGETTISYLFYCAMIANCAGSSIGTIFTECTATLSGGAIRNDGTIEDITNSTFSGNSAALSGGAIWNGGDIYISFTTIANNEAKEGGGIFESGLSVNIRNSIVAFNTATTGPNCNENIETEPAETNNYSNDDSCGFSGDDTIIVLGPLADNGGPTQTLALLGGHPINGASADCEPLDTGVPLPNDQTFFPRPFGPVCDSGAYETQLSVAPLSALFSFFDLRDRESFVQLTNIDSLNGTVHVQIFDVSNNCSENNFFDTYTPDDTHVYNMRDIQTNDGNPSGVILPDGAYGFVSIVPVAPLSIIGNFRVIDDNGYEYRANSVNPQNGGLGSFTEGATFNFNTKGNITLSDVVGLTFNLGEGEVSAADILDNFFPVDINIVNENEVIFSCRNVVFACTDQDNPLLEALLEEAGVASVASFEYGINNAIPHSKGGELLCPGNTTSDGVVTIERISTDSQDTGFIGIIGLNNGNGRGSMDSWWYSNTEALQTPPPG